MNGLKDESVNFNQKTDAVNDALADKSYATWVENGRKNMNPKKWRHRLGAVAMHEVGAIPGSLLNATGVPIGAPLPYLSSYWGWKRWGRKDVNPDGYYAFNSETEINKNTCINPTTPGFTREQTRKAFPDAVRILKGSNLIINFPAAFGDTTGVNSYGFSQDSEDAKLDNKVHDIPREIYNHKNSILGRPGAWGTGAFAGFVGAPLGILGGAAAGGAAGLAIGAPIAAATGDSSVLEATGIGGAITGGLVGNYVGLSKGYKFGKKHWMRMDVQFNKFYAFKDYEPKHMNCLNEFNPSESREKCRKDYPDAARILKGSTLYALYPEEFSAS